VPCDADFRRAAIASGVNAPNLSLCSMIRRNLAHKFRFAGEFTYPDIVGSQTNTTIAIPTLNVRPRTDSTRPVTAVAMFDVAQVNADRSRP
jgi:hypothetical protein